MRIVFMGTAEFGIPTLRILNERYDIPAVVTRPDRPKGRGRELQKCPVRIEAESLGIPVLAPEKLTEPEFLANLARYDADLFFVVAFRILPKDVFTMPPKGTVNLHSSLLPDYRGAAPIQWAVINGDDVTGLTTFFIDENIDTGDILLQTELPIGPNETAGELYDRMMVAGAELSLKTADLIEHGMARPSPQPERATRPAPKLFKENGLIDWSKDARTVHNLVRGTNPVPGAYIESARGPLKIHRTAIIEEQSSGNPGHIAEASPKKGIVVSCGKGSLHILELQPPGKKPMDSAAYVRGYGAETGTAL